jgi:hypothetical protein
MKEQFINYKTALLAKEKGLDLKSNYFREQEEGDADFDDDLSNRNELDGYVTIITQSLLQKWLRDKHKIFIYCIPKGFEKCDGKKIIRWGNNISIRNNKFSSTYEKSLEFGLQEALKTIL